MRYLCENCLSLAFQSNKCNNDACLIPLVVENGDGVSMLCDGTIGMWLEELYRDNTLMKTKFYRNAMGAGILCRCLGVIAGALVSGQALAATPASFREYKMVRQAKLG